MIVIKCSEAIVSSKYRLEKQADKQESEESKKDS